jgi:hypothetical protein
VRPATLAPARSALFLRAGAAATLGLGYADLIRGGTTLAPVLLVVGYVLLVPAVVLTWR